MSENTLTRIAGAVFVVLLMTALNVAWWGFWTVAFADPEWPRHLWDNPSDWAIAWRLSNDLVEVLALFGSIGIAVDALKTPVKETRNEAP